MTETASVFKAMGDPTRQAIIGMLCQRRMAVGEIAAHFPISRPAVAKHLAIMRRSGLVEVQVSGREHVHYLRHERLQDAQNWIETMSRFWDNKLELLKNAVESDNE